MPQISLSLDLFIIACFGIVISYVFIIGKQKSMMIILATYISAITVHGTVRILSRMLKSSDMTMASIGIPLDATMIALAKIIFLALCIIIFMLKSGVFVTYEKEAGSILTMIYTGLFGFAAAGLIVTTILGYIAQAGVLSTAFTLSGTMMSPANSWLLQYMILYQDVWYTLPSFLILALGFLHKD